MNHKIIETKIKQSIDARIQADRMKGHPRRTRKAKVPPLDDSR